MKSDIVIYYSNGGSVNVQNKNGSSKVWYLQEEKKVQHNVYGTKARICHTEPCLNMSLA